MHLKEKCWNLLYDRNEYMHKCEEEFRLMCKDRTFLQRIIQTAFIWKNYFRSIHKTELKINRDKLIFHKNWKDKIEQNDIISFDVFDTLLFRPCMKPQDLFYFLEYENQIPDFRRIRIQAENEARRQKKDGEVTIWEIYSVLAKWCSIDLEDAVKKEFEMEKKLTFTNPMSMEMYHYAIQKGKKIIVVSDMYFPENMLREILLEKGLKKIDEVFVSCDYLASKKTGILFELVNKKYPKEKKVHIGDNKRSDIVSSRKHGWDTIYIENVNKSKECMRGAITEKWMGSVYAGLINSYIYSGVHLKIRDPYYFYGFVYGGILTYGFCQWLNRIVNQRNIDKVLFLSRDCKIISKIYNQHYETVDNLYIQSSRISMLPFLCFTDYELFIQEAFEKRFFVEHMSIEAALSDLGLDIICDAYFRNQINTTSSVGQKEWDYVKKTILEHIDEVQKAYAENYHAFQQYIDECIGTGKRICIVDVGWRGSSILYLKQYIEKKYQDKTVMGAMLFYADIPYSQTWAASENISGFVISPLKKNSYNLQGKRNIYYSKSRLYLEYIYSDCSCSLLNYCKDEFGDVSFEYEKRDVEKNSAIISKMHEGIVDFSNYYCKILGKYAKTLVIGEEVSFEPIYNLLLEKKSLKKIFHDFNEKDSTLHGYKDM